MACMHETIGEGEVTKEMRNAVLEERRVLLSLLVATHGDLRRRASTTRNKTEQFLVFS